MSSNPFRYFKTSPAIIRLAVMLYIRFPLSLQKLAAIHSSVYNHFNQERHLCSRENFKLNRAAALAEWRELSAA